MQQFLLLALFGAAAAQRGPSGGPCTGEGTVCPLPCPMGRNGVGMVGLCSHGVCASCGPPPAAATGCTQDSNGEDSCAVHEFCRQATNDYNGSFRRPPTHILV